MWAGKLDKIMATRKRHSREQVRKLTTVDRLLSEGEDVAAVPQAWGIRVDVFTCGATSSAGCRPMTPSGSKIWNVERNAQAAWQQMISGIDSPGGTAIGVGAAGGS
jgi:hypothetical protein